MSQASDNPVRTLKKEAPGDLPVMLKQPTFIYNLIDRALNSALIMPCTYRSSSQARLFCPFELDFVGMTS